MSAVVSPGRVVQGDWPAAPAAAAALVRVAKVRQVVVVAVVAVGVWVAAVATLPFGVSGCPWEPPAMPRRVAVLRGCGAVLATRAVMAHPVHLAAMAALAAAVQRATLAVMGRLVRAGCLGAMGR